MSDIWWCQVRSSNRQTTSSVKRLTMSTALSLMVICFISGGVFLKQITIYFDFLRLTSICFLPDKLTTSYVTVAYCLSCMWRTQTCTSHPRTCGSARRGQCPCHWCTYNEAQWTQPCTLGYGTIHGETRWYILSNAYSLLAVCEGSTEPLHQYIRCTNAGEFADQYGMVNHIESLTVVTE